MSESSPIRLLVIDSDNVRRGLLACSLPPAKFTIEFAGTPQHGLNLLAQFQPAVVLLGWSAPSDLSERIRSLPSGRECSLILMNERFRDQSAGLLAVEDTGADAFVAFPFELTTLDTLLDEIAARTGTQYTTGADAAVCTAKPPRPQVASAASGKACDARWAHFRGRVDELTARLDSATYYQLLGVRPSANAESIKQAFFDRSVEFHPDRFMSLENEHLKQQVYQLFKRMSEAFKVLSNPQAKSQYDSNLSRPGAHIRYTERQERSLPVCDPADEALTPAGKKFLKHAALAESEGKLRTTRMYLSMALQCEPDNAPLQQHLESITSRLGLRVGVRKPL